MLRVPRNPWTLLAFALGTALLLGLGAYRILGWPDRIQRVRLRVDSLEGLPGPERLGLEQLLIHQLEVLGGMPVLRWPEAGQAGKAGSRRELFLQVGGRRRGSDLGLDLTWSWGPAGSQQHTVLQPASPDETLNRLFEALPLGLSRPPAGRAWPRQESAFWQLLTSLGLIDLRSEGERSLMLARSAVDQAPDCAEAQLNLGSQLYSQMQWNPSRDSMPLDLAVASFEAGLAAQPGHPRGTRDLVVLYTDTGRSKEALDLLGKAIALHPGVPRLYEALAYASRTAGLLEISQRAFRTQHRLGLDQTHQVGETTFLYLEDWPGFLATCVPTGQPVDTKAWFYRGYVHLARGDREQAFKAFQEAGRVKEGWYGFEELARVLALHIEGRGEEAHSRLVALDKSRVGLRIPDGEFTFKQAEAHALLGDSEEAMDLASRAFSQGFCCVRWYEKSPFLAPLRSHPRWAGLMQRAAERQAQLEGRFSPKSFGL